jgi:hypothetical protein
MVYLMLSRLFTRGGEALWHHIVGYKGLSAHHTTKVVAREI